jgi:hypothetical protein
MALQELNSTGCGKHTRPAGGIDIGQTGAPKYMIKERLAIAVAALLVAPTVSSRLLYVH